jgi:hypothetical protein
MPQHDPAVPGLSCVQCKKRLRVRSHKKKPGRIVRYRCCACPARVVKTEEVAYAELAMLRKAATALAALERKQEQERKRLADQQQRQGQQQPQRQPQYQPQPQRRAA